MFQSWGISEKASTRHNGPAFAGSCNHHRHHDAKNASGDDGDSDSDNDEDNHIRKSHCHTHKDKNENDHVHNHGNLCCSLEP